VVDSLFVNDSSIAANALEYSRGSSHMRISELHVNVFRVHNT
jgi:hypothetical protein